MRYPIYFFAALMFVSCEYSYLEDADSSAIAPTQFTQKAIVELFNGAWCGFSPDADYMVKQVNDYVDPSRYMYIQYHLADQMDILADDLLFDQFYRSGIPMGMVNRINGQTESRYVGGMSGYDNYDPETNNNFLVKTLAVHKETADCGLAIDASAVTQDQIELKVKLAIGPNGLDIKTDDADFYLNVILIESEMSGSGTGWDYVNWYSKFSSSVFGPTHPHYDDTDPIVGYKHSNVVRDVMTEVPFGDLIDSEVLEAGSVHEYSFDIPTAGHGDDLKIIAFLYQMKPMQLTQVSWVHNVQFVDVGGVQGFD